MKVVRIVDGKPSFEDAELPGGDGVRVRVATASICGSDLHMIDNGWAEGLVMGHEFAGYTDDGSAVTVEPNLGCGHCWACAEGHRSHCTEGTRYVGINVDGGMAEYVLVPEASIFRLPSGLDVDSACLIEPLAVAAHGLNRARVSAKDKVLVVGAGPIGLATAAILQGRGMAFDITARYPHQQAAAATLGGHTEASDGYDVVVDAVGSSDSIADAIARCRPMGRVALVGSLWTPASLDIAFCARELELIAATTYRAGHKHGEFNEAAQVLQQSPHITDALITHRYPLEAAAEAFDTAAHRASGAIKVMFDVSS
jgi:2-desacetyl-2-hydroxyethyl bacteriochlorophyllide A dehydrogenase